MRDGSASTFIEELLEEVELKEEQRQKLIWIC